MTFRERLFSPSVTDDHSTAAKVARIRELADKSMTAAREAYEEEFDIKHTDNIDWALNDALSRSISSSHPYVMLETEIALALWLRRRGWPAGRQPLPDLTQLMLRARRRKREIMDEFPRRDPRHVKAAKAEQTVAAEFLEESGLRTVTRFIETMKRTNLWNPETRRRPGRG